MQDVSGVLNAVEHCGVVWNQINVWKQEAALIIAGLVSVKQDVMKLQEAAQIQYVIVIVQVLTL